MESMVAWIVSFLVSVTSLTAPNWTPESKETPQERQARYESIARDLLTVVYDPAEAPLFKNGDLTRAKTATVLLAIARYESGGYRRDVDFNLGKEARGDHGRSWCLMQVQLGAPNQEGKSPTRIVLTSDGRYEWAKDKTSGFGGEDLISDRKNCFRAALHMARVSFNACAHMPLEERLSVYASGKCDENGAKPSRTRMARALKWMSDQTMKPPMTDAAFLAILHPAPTEAANDNASPTFVNLAGTR